MSTHWFNLDKKRLRVLIWILKSPPIASISAVSVVHWISF